MRVVVLILLVKEQRVKADYEKIRVDLDFEVAPKVYSKLYVRELRQLGVAEVVCKKCLKVEAVVVGGVVAKGRLVLVFSVVVTQGGNNDCVWEVLRG